MKQLVLASLLAALVVPACHRQSSSGGDAPDTDTDAGTDTDVDSDTDTDTDTDSDPLDCAGGRYDESTGLCWQHPNASGTYEWQEAVDYCNGLSLAGHDDWYMPSRDDFVELLGGCDGTVLSGGFGYCNSCEESETCGALFDADTGWYWSSSPYDTDLVWVVGFGDGRVDIDFVDYLYAVRCVRSGP